MENENRTIRIPLLLTPAEVEEIDDWQFSNRIRTRSEAIRDLMRRTLDGGKGSDDRDAAPPGATAG